MNEALKRAIDKQFGEEEPKLSKKRTREIVGSVKYASKCSLELGKESPEDISVYCLSRSDDYRKKGDFYKAVAHALGVGHAALEGEYHEQPKGLPFNQYTIQFNKKEQEKYLKMADKRIDLALEAAHKSKKTDVFDETALKVIDEFKKEYRNYKKKAA